VRVVALTLRDLPREVERGRFRADLYHRLSTLQLVLPPLRERRDDLPPLTDHFLAELARELGPRELTAAARARLAAHDWPGNVRELRNVIRRAAILCEAIIDTEDLELQPASARPPGEVLRAAEPAIDDPVLPCGCAQHGPVLPLAGKTFVELELAIYRHFLIKNGGSRRKAARELGISRSTFCDRVKRFGL
jgi:DNA-binding NtrC family response regulator